ncbi:MAG: porin family protein [Bacteroidota bacterium]
MKTLKIVVLLFAFQLTATAQENEAPPSSKRDRDNISSREAKRKFVFGLKAGLNNSNVYDTQGLNFVANPKTGFAGGIFAALPIGGFIGLQPEVLISQKGFVGSGTVNNEKYTLNRTTTFLDIPLQLQIKPVRFFSLLAGIQYSYLLNQNDEYVFDNSSIDHNQQFDNSNIQKNLLAAVGGFDINIRHLVLSGRTGFDLQYNNGDGSSTNPRYKNVWLQGTIGYRFY